MPPEMRLQLLFGRQPCAAHVTLESGVAAVPTANVRIQIALVHVVLWAVVGHASKHLLRLLVTGQMHLVADAFDECAVARGAHERMRLASVRQQFRPFVEYLRALVAVVASLVEVRLTVLLQLSGV